LTELLGSPPEDHGATPAADSMAMADPLIPAPGLDAQALAAAEQEAQEAQEDARRASRLQRLMQRIATNADFASMTNSIRGVQKVVRSERAHVRALTNEIADDVAMTGKLLRLINAAFYSSAGAGKIVNMQHAVTLMGFQTVGLLASSLMLFERLPKSADGERLRHEFGKAQMAALLAHEFCNSGKHLESAYMTALFQNLGSMLGGMHFGEELVAIDAQLTQLGLVAGDPAHFETKEKLARLRWGLGIEEIGVEVARQWGWPEPLRIGMRSMQPADLESAAAPEKYLRVLCTAANTLAGDLLKLPDTGSPEQRAEVRKDCIDRFSARMAVPLGLDPEQLHDAVENIKLVWDDLAKAQGFTAAPRTGKANDPKHKKASDPAVAEALSSTLVRTKELILDGAPVTQLLQLLMKTMYDTLELQRVIVCLRDPAQGGLRGCMGLGDRATTLAPVFVIPLQPPSELFGLLCANAADTLISDVSAPIIARRLPDWFGQAQAQTFLLLPMMAGNQVLGAFYGDKERAGQLSINERELMLLKTLRNQIVKALRLTKNAQ
jgi:HD-like signal output (HDOD) protein